MKFRMLLTAACITLFFTSSVQASIIQNSGASSSFDSNSK